jgi:hypothetical protein
MPNSSNINNSLPSIDFLSQNRMWWNNGNIFQWQTYICNNQLTNFWHGTTNWFWTWKRKMKVIQKIITPWGVVRLWSKASCASSDVWVLYKNISVR